MKVKDLIEKLKKCNQDAPVITRDSELNGFFELKVCQPIKVCLVPEEYKKTDKFIGEYANEDWLSFCIPENQIEAVLIDLEEYKEA
ncbi:MAG TPA: hypothetical protein DDW17_02205 [Deltaproteobacteria bacterium]|nr:hypothetical protein [Deltaproteobacteria bacterium]